MAMMMNPEQFDRIYATMAHPVRVKIARNFAAVLDGGADLFDPATRTSPAGEAVMVAMVADARAKGWGDETVSMLRWNIRAVGRRLILDALATA
jgi:hypothetical protein